MSGYILRENDPSIVLTADQVDRLVKNGDGDAALLYLLLMRADRGITEQELKEQMDYNGCIYNTELLGVEKFAQAMYEMGFVDKQLTMEELAFPNVKYQ